MPFVRALRDARSSRRRHRHPPHRRRAGPRARVRAPVVRRRRRITHVVIAFIDITREVEAERGARRGARRRCSQAQRMESIGNLAGGIAHDFNNLLAVIRVLAGSCAAAEARPAGAARSSIRSTRPRRARVELTRSLLGFARRGKNLAARVSVNAVVIAMARPRASAPSIAGSRSIQERAGRARRRSATRRSSSRS